MPTVGQSIMMGQSYSISTEGLNHVPKWSNRSSKVSHLVFSLGQWCTIVADQILCDKVAQVSHFLDPTHFNPAGKGNIHLCV